MIQPSAQADWVTLFRLRGGCLSAPIPFAAQLPAEAVAEQHRASKPLSMEARINEALAAAPEMAHLSNQEKLEHLALLKRWYFRSVKTGEIFFADDKGVLPMRRIVRGISRVYKGERPEEPPANTN
jgi:hypothetical protein